MFNKGCIFGEKNFECLLYLQMYFHEEGSHGTYSNINAYLVQNYIEV
jgi:hypothetical protein